MTGIDSGIENNEKYLNLKVGDHVRISKYKNIFAKDYAPNWSEKVFLIKKNKLTVPQTYVSESVHGENIVGTFCEKKLQKTN